MSISMSSNNLFWRRFRRSEIWQRRNMLRALGYLQRPAIKYLCPNKENTELADQLIESAIGVVGVPLGIVQAFLIDGKTFHVPLATEEASVLAASSYAAGIVARHGGFTTEAPLPEVRGQLVMEGVPSHFSVLPESLYHEIRDRIRKDTARMEVRGGGFRRMEWRHVKDDLYSLDVYIDVRDAMGANLINTVLEALAPLLESACGGASRILAVVSNDGGHRCYHAGFSIPIGKLPCNGKDGRDLARRIVRAAELAQVDASRAVTHNKGIMNGVTALALATGNDSRAIEASIHAYAGRAEGYKGLGTYHIAGDILHASLTLPLFFATSGGSTDVHPVALWSKQLLAAHIGEKLNATLLGRIAVSVGLAQNFAALLALVGEGLQAGHMKLHERKRRLWTHRFYGNRSRNTKKS